MTYIGKSKKTVSDFFYNLFNILKVHRICTNCCKLKLHLIVSKLNNDVLIVYITKPIYVYIRSTLIKIKVSPLVAKMRLLVLILLVALYTLTPPSFNRTEESIHHVRTNCVGRLKYGNGKCRPVA